jgi:hypothetical protein
MQFWDCKKKDDSEKNDRQNGASSSGVRNDVDDNCVVIPILQ